MPLRLRPTASPSGGVDLVFRAGQYAFLNGRKIDDSFPSGGPANGKIGQFGFEFFTYARVAF